MTTTLFSPIGTADPMTRLGDGPMLHLLRHRKPDKVILFLSPKIQGFQKQDCRYTRAIDDCAKLLGMLKPEVEIIESQFDEVYRFDYYIEEFEKALGAICQSKAEDEILVNVSSGTPGMQQALVAIGAFGRYNVKLLQVVTPRADANKREDRERQDDYDYEYLWSQNPDNNGNAPCRIVEVETPNFSARLVRENVIALIKRYDYEAASQFASSYSIISPEAKTLIEGAAYRLNLDQDSASDAFSSAMLGIRELEYRANNPLYEYVQMLGVRLAQGHYADFVRAITPAVTETLMGMLDPHLPRKEYLSSNWLSQGEYRFDGEKICDNHPDLAALLKDKCDIRPNNKFMKGNVFITNRVLMKMVKHYRTNKSEKARARMEKLKRLDSFESKIRNIAAHQIRKMDKEFIERRGGNSLENVYSYLCDLNGINPGLYDAINEKILALL